MKPFCELRERLLRAGVAPRHVRRYLAELADHLADLTAEEERAGRSRSDADSAGLVRLGSMDDLARAMTEQRRFQSMCVRAPWAVFGFAPLAVLAGAWFVALAILWSGWKHFLPGADTPFVPIDGFAIVYFGVGRLVFFGAPVLVGWGISLVAARQRYRPVWPLAGLVLVALIGGTAQVHAIRAAVAGGVGHVSLDFAPGSFAQSFSVRLLHAAVILAFTVVPYLVWRLREKRLFPA